MTVYFVNIMALMFFIPAVNRFANQYMYIKLIVEVHGLVFAAILLGIRLQKVLKLSDGEENDIKKFIEKFNPLGITSIIFLIGSLVFWMIPRSVDLMVINDLVNYIMLANIYMAGIFFGISLLLMPFSLKTAVAIYGLSMMLTLGTIDLSVNGLLCAVYDIEMQRQTGEYFLKLFPFLFILFLYRVYKNLGRLT